jgi:hypothetical protein
MRFSKLLLLLGLFLNFSVKAAPNAVNCSDAFAFISKLGFTDDLISKTLTPAQTDEFALLIKQRELLSTLPADFFKYLERRFSEPMSFAVDKTKTSYDIDNALRNELEKLGYGMSQFETMTSKDTIALLNNPILLLDVVRNLKNDPNAYKSIADFFPENLWGYLPDDTSMFSKHTFNPNDSAHIQMVWNAVQIAELLNAFQIPATPESKALVWLFAKHSPASAIRKTLAFSYAADKQEASVRLRNLYSVLINNPNKVNPFIGTSQFDLILTEMGYVLKSNINELQPPITKQMLQIILQAHHDNLIYGFNTFTVMQNGHSIFFNSSDVEAFIETEVIYTANVKAKRMLIEILNLTLFSSVDTRQAIIGVMQISKRELEDAIKAYERKLVKARDADKTPAVTSTPTAPRVAPVYNSSKPAVTTNVPKAPKIKTRPNQAVTKPSESSSDTVVIDYKITALPEAFKDINEHTDYLVRPLRTDLLGEAFVVTFSKSALRDLVKLSPVKQEKILKSLNNGYARSGAGFFQSGLKILVGGDLSKYWEVSVFRINERLIGPQDVGPHDLIRINFVDLKDHSSIND